MERDVEAPKSKERQLTRIRKLSHSAKAAIEQLLEMATFFFPQELLQYLVMPLRCRIVVLLRGYGPTIFRDRILEYVCHAQNFSQGSPRMSLTWL
jgi:hypothetical protein